MILTNLPTSFLPIVEHPPPAGAVGVFARACGSWSARCPGRPDRSRVFELDHFPVHQGREGAVEIEHVGDAAAHAGREIATRLAQDHGPAAGHVLAAMIADSLDDRRGAAVADAEPLARDAAQIKLAAGCAVEHDVAGDDVVLGHEGAFARRIDDDLAAGEALAAVVVDVALDADRDAVHAKGHQALAGAAAEIQLNRCLRS